MKRYSPQDTLNMFLSSAAYHTEHIINDSSDGDTYRWTYPFFSIRSTGPNLYKVCKIDLCKTFDIAVQFACPGWGYPNVFVGGLVNVFISDVRFSIELNGVCGSLYPFNIPEKIPYLSDEDDYIIRQFFDYLRDNMLAIRNKLIIAEDDTEIVNGPMIETTITEEDNNESNNEDNP